LKNALKKLTVVWNKVEIVAGIPTTDKYDDILPYVPNLSLYRKWLLTTNADTMLTAPRKPEPAFKA
jgi:hypothetical protein